MTEFLGSIPIRETGYRPPGTAHVVRGGALEPSDLVKSAETCLTLYQVLGLTIWVAEVPRLEDLVAQTGTLISCYGQIGVCSLAVLGDYVVAPTGQAPHYTLVLPSTSEDDLERFRSCFLIMPNPLVS